MAARLEYEITGSVSGLASAASQATGILNNLQSAANKLSVKLFSAETVGDINNIGAALTGVNVQIQNYLDNALKSNQAFKDQQSQQALDSLATKLQVASGNATLFGGSIKNSQQQISAYQTAINSLLANGYDPLDSKVVSLKNNIDSLTDSINNQKAASSRAPTGILNNLQNTSSQLNTKLYSATSVSEINGIAGALEIVNAKIKEYISNATTASSAFKEGQTKSALDSLSAKLQVITGNIQLFGSSIDLDKQQLAAYQNTINSLLSAGISPFDDKVTVLKSKIDALTASIQQQKDAAKPLPPPVEERTLGLIEAATRDLNDFRDAKKKALTVNDIAIFDQKIAQTEQRLKGLQTAGGNVNQSLTATGRSAASAGIGINSFNLELGRIVQDAPFAANNFGAIGNNITRAFEVLPQYRDRLREVIVAQGGTATSGAVLRQGLTSLFTGFSGLSLALSLAISAYTIYQQREQAAARSAEAHKSAVDKVKQVLEDYISTLSASSRAEAGAFGNVQDSIIKLQEEVYAIQNNTKALFDGLTARQAIAKDFPAFTKGYDVAKASVADFTAILEKGTAALEAFGRVQAANDLAKGFQKTQIQNQVAAKGLIAPLQQLEGQLEVLQKGFRFGQDFDETLGPAIRGIAGLKKQITEYNTAAASAGKQAKSFYDVANQELPNASNGQVAKTPATKNPAVDPFIAISNALDDIIRKNSSLANESGLQGYDLQVQKIKNNYISINAEIDKQNAKLNTLSKRKLTPAQNGELVFNRNKVTQARSGAAASEEKELADAQIAEAERVSNEVQRINNEFGVKQEQSRNRELAGIDKLYDAEVVKAAGNATILTALDAGRLNAKDAINEKYLIKERQLQDSISGIVESANAELNDGEEKRTARIAAEYNKRKIAAARYFDELRKVSPEKSGEIGQLQAQVNLLLDTVSFKKQSEELSKNFATAMQQGVNAFAQNFYTAITTLGEQRSAIDLKYDLQLEQAGDESTRNEINRLRELEQATTTSFGAIFSSLTQSLFQTFNKSIFDSFTKRLTENLGTTLIGPSQDQIASQATAALIQNAGINFAANVTSAGVALAASLGVASAGTVTASATASKNITTAGTQLSKGVAGALAGLSVAGGLISGITPKTSAVGQGLGGALSGAGTGALLGSSIPVIGTVAGAIVGGLVGALGGILGASKAKKQEELQRQQLAEQKKQSAYLQSLAYTATIVGRVTAEGTVTGVTIDAFGKLVAQISGKDLQFVLDRNAKTRI